MNRKSDKYTLGIIGVLICAILAVPYLFTQSVEETKTFAEPDAEGCVTRKWMDTGRFMTYTNARGQIVAWYNDGSSSGEHKVTVGGSVPNIQNKFYIPDPSIDKAEIISVEAYNGSNFDFTAGLGKGAYLADNTEELNGYWRIPGKRENGGDYKQNYAPHQILPSISNYQFSPTTGDLTINYSVGLDVTQAIDILRPPNRATLMKNREKIYALLGLPPGGGDGNIDAGFNYLLRQKDSTLAKLEAKFWIVPTVVTYKVCGKGLINVNYICLDGTVLQPPTQVKLTRDDIGKPKTINGPAELGGNKRVGYSYSLGGKAPLTPTKTFENLIINDITADNLNTTREVNVLYDCDEPPDPEEPCPPGTTPGGSSGYIIPEDPNLPSNIMQWRSEPYSYGEIKDCQHGDGRAPEFWNAMAGLPHDEQLFLDIGASIFSLDIVSDKHDLELTTAPENHTISGGVSAWCMYETSYIPSCSCSGGCSPPVTVTIDACTGSTWDAGCSTDDKGNCSCWSGGYTVKVDPNRHIDYSIHKLEILNHKVLEYDLRGISAANGLLRYVTNPFPLQPKEFVSISIEEQSPSIELHGLSNSEASLPIWQNEIWYMNAMKTIKSDYPNSYMLYKPRLFNIHATVAGKSFEYIVLQDKEVELPSTQEAQPGNKHLAYKAKNYTPTSLGKQFGSNHEVETFPTSWSEAVSVTDPGECSPPSCNQSTTEKKDFNRSLITPVAHSKKLKTLVEHDSCYTTTAGNNEHQVCRCPLSHSGYTCERYDINDNKLPCSEVVCKKEVLLEQDCAVENKIFRYMYWEIDEDPDTTIAETNFLPVAHKWNPKFKIDYVGFLDYSSDGSRRALDIPLFYKDGIRITDIPNGQKKSERVQVDYRRHEEDPNVGAEYIKFPTNAKYVNADNEAPTKYTEGYEDYKINDIIVHDPVSISRFKIDPEPLSDHRVPEQARWLPVKLHPDSWFDISFEHLYLKDGTIDKHGLLNITKDKSLEYKKGLETKKWISSNASYGWKKGDPPENAPGRFIIAPTELWRVKETSPDKWEIEERDGKQLIFQKGEVIPLPINEGDRFRFFIPLSADEFASNSIYAYVMGTNNVNSHFDPHIDGFNEKQWLMTNHARFDEQPPDKSGFRADHFSQRNRVVDIVGRIGNFTWNYTKDPLWQNYFRYPLKPESWIINRVIKKPELLNLYRYIMTNPDAYDNTKSLLDKGTGINRFFMETQYDPANARHGHFEASMNNDLPMLSKKDSKLGYPIYWTFHTIGQRETTEPIFSVTYDFKSKGYSGPVDMYVSTRGGKFERIDNAADEAKVKEFLLRTKLSEYMYNPVSSSVLYYFG